VIGQLTRYSDSQRLCLFDLSDNKRREIIAAPRTLPECCNNRRTLEHKVFNLFVRTASILIRSREEDDLLLLANFTARPKSPYHFKQMNRKKKPINEPVMEKHVPGQGYDKNFGRSTKLLPKGIGK